MMDPMKYYVVVELRDYSGKVIGSSSCNCDTDITDQTIKAAAAVAGSLMVEHDLRIKDERRKRKG